MLDEDDDDGGVSFYRCELLGSSVGPWVLLCILVVFLLLFLSILVYFVLCRFLFLNSGYLSSGLE
jgi:uncharacterized membrane protein